MTNTLSLLSMFSNMPWVLLDNNVGACWDKDSVQYTPIYGILYTYITPRIYGKPCRRMPIDTFKNMSPVSPPASIPF